MGIKIGNIFLKKYLTLKFKTTYKETVYKTTNFV